MRGVVILLSMHEGVEIFEFPDLSFEQEMSGLRKLTIAQMILEFHNQGCAVSKMFQSLDAAFSVCCMVYSSYPFVGMGACGLVVDQAQEIAV